MYNTITQSNNHTITVLQRTRLDGAPSARKDQINIRCTPEEKEQLQRLAEASDMSVTRYILQSTVYADTPLEVPKIDIEPLENLYRELNAQGVNLNQIAHVLNRYSKSPKGLVETKLLKAITDLAVQTRQELSTTLMAVAKALGACRRYNQRR